MPKPRKKPTRPTRSYVEERIHKFNTVRSFLQDSCLKHSTAPSSLMLSMETWNPIKCLSDSTTYARSAASLVVKGDYVQRSDSVAPRSDSAADDDGDDDDDDENAAMRGDTILLSTPVAIKVELFSICQLSNVIQWRTNANHTNRQNEQKQRSSSHQWYLAWDRKTWLNWMHVEWREIRIMCQLALLIKHNLNPHFVYIYQHFVGCLPQETWKEASKSSKNWVVDTLRPIPCERTNRVPNDSFTDYLARTSNLSYGDNHPNQQYQQHQQHPQLVPIASSASLSLGRVAIGKWLIQEVERKSTLDTLMKKHARANQLVDDEWLLSCVYQIMSGVTSAHFYAGISHMDLYSRNVFYQTTKYKRLRYKWTILNEQGVAQTITSSVPSNGKMWMLGDWGMSAQKKAPTETEMTMYWKGRDEHDFVPQSILNERVHMSSYRNLNPVLRDLLTFLIGFFYYMHREKTQTTEIGGGRGGSKEEAKDERKSTPNANVFFSPLSDSASKWIWDIIKEMFMWPTLTAADQRNDGINQWLSTLFIPRMHTWFSSSCLRSCGMDSKLADGFLTTTNVEQNMDQCVVSETKKNAVSPIYLVADSNIQQRIQLEWDKINQECVHEIEKWTVQFQAAFDIQDGL